jgi:uncharacterized protein YndB with AHSA1/START domain
MTIVRISRILAASQESVWAAFTKPEALAAWFWPAAFATTVSADVRPGGRWRIQAKDMAVSGSYEQVDPPKRLVFSWCWDGEETQSLVTIELSAQGDKTQLLLMHDRLDDTAAELHAQGWNDCLDRLPTWLAD